jgi:hypothetical protein
MIEDGDLPRAVVEDHRGVIGALRSATHPLALGDARSPGGVADQGVELFGNENLQSATQISMLVDSPGAPQVPTATPTTSKPSAKAAVAWRRS